VAGGQTVQVDRQRIVWMTLRQKDGMPLPWLHDKMVKAPSLDD
jgi:hypothetical protein